MSNLSDFLHWIGWREAGPTLQDRINKQVHEMSVTCNAMALEHTARLGVLETDVDGLKARSENVDAHYVRTVTLALSENLDKRDAAWHDRYDRLEASFAKVELELRGLIDTCILNSSINAESLAALRRKLRMISED